MSVCLSVYIVIKLLQNHLPTELSDISAVSTVQSKGVSISNMTFTYIKVTGCVSVCMYVPKYLGNC